MFQKMRDLKEQFTDYSSEKQRNKLLINKQSSNKDHDDDVTITALKQENAQLKLDKKKTEAERDTERFAANYYRRYYHNLLSEWNVGIATGSNESLTHP